MRSDPGPATVFAYERMKREPGQLFEGYLTDRELLRAPARLLNPDQRRRRRRLKKQQTRPKNDERRREVKRNGHTRILYCQAYTKAGNPCRAYALTGAKHCRKHLNDAEKVKLDIQNISKPKGVRPQSPTTAAPKMARLVMETIVDKLFARYLKALGMELIGFDEDNMPIVLDHGMERGLCLHGESKDGYIEMSRYPDMQGQIQIIEKLWDRTYGKPKQTQVLEGGDKPIHVEPVKSQERAQQVITILQRSHAVRRIENTAPPAIEAKPEEVHEEEEESNSKEGKSLANVVPLNDE